MTQPLPASQLSTPIIQVRRLDFAYSDRLVLKHITFDLPRGSTLGLVGPNGGGKTTLLQLLIGLLLPTRGELLIDSLAPAVARSRGLIGYLPQRCELNTRMPLSVSQCLHLSLPDRPSPADTDHLDHLVQAIGLQDLLEEPIGTLSGGQLQRLLIARALVNRPALLVLDEPTTGIDVASRHQFIDLVRKLKSELNLSIVMSTHDLHALRALCDDIACLNLTVHLHHRQPGEEITLDETTCSLK